LLTGLLGLSKKEVGSQKLRGVISVISYYLDSACRAASIDFFSLMLLLVLFQVIARYVFQMVPVWTEEAARYCMI
jgi:TRAP-type C4-dicarboxylate transport system permease small subunit